MACKKSIGKRKMGFGGSLSADVQQTSINPAMGNDIASMIYGTTVGLGQYIGNQQELNQLQQKQDLYKSMYASSATLNPLLNNNRALMPYGGMTGAETVELERGEVMRTPDGNINSISNTAPTHAQGGVLITLPNGTEVLGKKEFMDEEYKELGKKIEYAQNKYMKALENNPTSITTNTTKRSLANLQKQFDLLFELQGEDTGSTQMPDGGIVNPASYKADSTITANYRLQQVPQAYGDYENRINGDLMLSNPLYDPNDRNKVIAVENYYKGVPGPQYSLPGELSNSRMEKYQVNDTTRFAGSEIPQFGDGGKIYIKPSKRGTFKAQASKMGMGVQEAASKILNAPEGRYSPAMRRKANFAKNFGGTRKGEDGLKTYGNVLGTSGYDYFNQSPNALSQFQRYAGLTSDNIYGPKTAEAFDVLGNEYFGFNNLKPKTPTITGSFNPQTELSSAYSNQVTNPITNSTTPTISSNTNIGDIFSTGAKLAPVLYNLGRGLQAPEQMTASDYYNPYNDQIRNTMANRRYNIKPELESNRLAEATYYRNLRENAPSQAQYLGGLQAGQIATQRANATAIARKQNIDNQYLAEQAQMDASLGSNIAQTNFNIADINARSRASNRNLIGTGLGQLSQYAQTNELMNNQLLRDAQRLNLLPDLFSNYSFRNGKWTYKDSDEEASTEEIKNYLKGISNA